MLLLILCSVLVQEIYAEYGVLYALSEDGQKSGHFCVAFNAKFHPIPTEFNTKIMHGLVDYSEQEGCTDTYPDTISKKMVAVARGNCTFVEKALIVQHHGAFGLLVVSMEHGSKLIIPGVNSSEDYKKVNTTMAFILHSDYTRVKDLGKSVRVGIYQPESSPLDPNAILVFSIALFCLVVGPYWAGVRVEKNFNSINRSQNASTQSTESGDGDSKKVKITFCFVFSLAASMCALIVLLYFFYDYLVYVIIAFFCLASASGLYICFSPLWERIFTCENRIPPNKIPLLSNQPKLQELGLVFVCLAITIFWVVIRNESYAWIIQDLLGIAFCIGMLVTIQMPSLKGCTLLLVILFFYDIFFVFITPFITKSGDSIMVDVATGGKSNSGEQLPMVFKVPRFMPSPLSVCDKLAFSLLGFGDIVIPGLLIAYNHRFDITVGSRKVYFITSLIAYSVGLVFTYLAVYLMRKGQPALLYLVPCTVLVTVAVAWLRGELRHIWTGEEDPKKNDDEIRNVPENITQNQIVSETSTISSSSSSVEGERKRLINA